MSTIFKTSDHTYESKGHFIRSLMEWYLMKPELIRKKRQQFLKS